MCFVKNQSSRVLAELETVIFVEYLFIYLLFYHCSCCFLIIYFGALAHTLKYKNAIFASVLSKYANTLSFEFGLCHFE